MSGNRIGPLAGYRPSAGPRNGLPESATRGYRRFGMPGWNPAKGVHYDEAEVMAVRTADGYEARLSAYADMVTQGMEPHEIALRLEVSRSTVTEYRRTLRRRAAEADAAEAAP